MSGECNECGLTPDYGCPGPIDRCKSKNIGPISNERLKEIEQNKSLIWASDVRKYLLTEIYRLRQVERDLTRELSMTKAAHNRMTEANVDLVRQLEALEDELYAEHEDNCHECGSEGFKLYITACATCRKVWKRRGM